MSKITRRPLAAIPPHTWLLVTALALSSALPTQAATRIWYGKVSSDWNNSQNWCSTPGTCATNLVPTAADDVFINVGLLDQIGIDGPNIPSGSSGVAQTVTLQTNGSLDVGGTLNVVRTFTNNSASYAFNGYDDGTVKFNSTSEGTIGGTSNTTFNNLMINSALGVGLVTSCKVKKLLTVNGGNLTVAPTKVLTLVSDAAGTAMVYNGVNFTTFTPNVVLGKTTVERYINPALCNNVGYRHYGVPVTGTTLADLNVAGQYAITSQTWATNYNNAAFVPAQNTRNVPVSQFPNLFEYRQNLVTNTYNKFSEGWYALGTQTAALPPGKGVSVVVTPAAKVDVSGTLVNGTVSVSGLALGLGTASVAGYHLLGNPYPSPIDWEANVSIGSNPDFSSAVSILRLTCGLAASSMVFNYDTYNNGVSTGATNRIIPMMQGIFVQRIATGPAGAGPATFTFQNSFRQTTYDNPFYYRAAPEARPLVRLQVAPANQPDLTATTVVYQQAGATAQGMDARYDAGLVDDNTGMPTIVTRLGATEYTINGMPLAIGAVALPVGIRGLLPGQPYVLNAAQILNFNPATTRVLLEDRLTGQRLDLNVKPTLRFVASGAAEATRFVLHLQPVNETADAANTAATPLLAVFPTVLRAGDVVNVQAETGADARAELFDGFGQSIAVRTLAGANAHAELPTAGLRRGVYTVRLTTASRTSVQRIVIE